MTCENGKDGKHCFSSSLGRKKSSKLIIFRLNWCFFRLQTMFKAKNFVSSTKKLFSHPQIEHQQLRGIVKVRLKWVKNRSLDHLIDTETDLKAACRLKDDIKRSPTGFLTAKSFSDWQKLIGLTVPVLRFLRRYFGLLSSIFEYPFVVFALFLQRKLNKRKAQFRLLFCYLLFAL